MTIYDEVATIINKFGTTTVKEVLATWEKDHRAVKIGAEVEGSLNPGNMYILVVHDDGSTNYFEVVEVR